MQKATAGHVDIRCNLSEAYTMGVRVSMVVRIYELLFMVEFSIRGRLLGLWM